MQCWYPNSNNAQKTLMEEHARPWAAAMFRGLPPSHISLGVNDSKSVTRHLATILQPSQKFSYNTLLVLQCYHYPSLLSIVVCQSERGGTFSVTFLPLNIFWGLWYFPWSVLYLFIFCFSLKMIHKTQDDFSLGIWSPVWKGGWPFNPLYSCDLSVILLYRQSRPWPGTDQ